MKISKPNVLTKTKLIVVPMQGETVARLQRGKMSNGFVHSPPALVLSLLLTSFETLFCKGRLFFFWSTTQKGDGNLRLYTHVEIVGIDTTMKMSKQNVLTKTTLGVVPMQGETMAHLQRGKVSNGFVHLPWALFLLSCWQALRLSFARGDYFSFAFTLFIFPFFLLSLGAT